MESDVLRIFCAVAKSGSITQASKELNTVQSNVTTRIRGLEDELGVKLLNRLKRGVTLTRAGERLLPHAMRIEGMLYEAMRDVNGRPGVPRGPLRIGSLETTAGIRLPGVIRRFAKCYPEVDLSLVTATTQTLVDEVLNYRLEAALVAGPVLRPELSAKAVFSERMAIISARSVRNLRTILRPENDVKILVFRSGCSYRNRLEEIVHSAGVQSVRLLEFGTLDGILGCVSAGLGITLLPTSTIKPSRWRNLVRMHKPPANHAKVDTLFIWRRDAFLSSALRRFIDIAYQSSARWVSS